MDEWGMKCSLSIAYNGVLSHHKKEWSADMCSNTGEPWKYYTEQEKLDTKIE